MNSPYAEAADAYLAGGFSPIPLPIGEKHPPPSGFTGYLGAYVTTEDVARWSEGRRNVGLRLPETVLGIDVDDYDGKAGGATFRDAEARLGELPSTWRSTSRPDDLVSGILLFRVPAGRSWANEVGPNIELIHHGHRFAVVAPSLHPEGREYRWFDALGLPAEAPSVAQLPELPQAWVADLDRGSVTDRTAKVDLKEGDAGRWLESLPDGEPCRVFMRVLADAERDFAGGGSHHDLARKHILRIVRHGEQGHVGANAARDTLESMWLTALSHREPGHGEWERMVAGAVALVLSSPTADADKGCCDTAAEVFTSAGGSKLPLAVQLRRHVEAHFDVFPAGDDGRIFAQRKTGGRAELVGSGFVMRAAQGLGDSAATLSAAATEAAKVLSALGAEHEPRRLAMRVHCQPDRIVLDLAQRGNTRCAVVTPDGWSIKDVPPVEIVFQASGSALPDPVHGGSIDELRTLLRWPEDDPRWPLVKGWLPAALLADQPRPMLGFFGPQGSAKTTTGRFVVGVLDPKPAGALGGGFGKSRADDETKALKSYLPAWDNVSTLSNEGADLLSRLVTGDLIERRQLYTDAELVTIHYRRTGVITGITVPRGVKPDTLDRFILVAVAPLSGERVSEGTLDAEWEQVQPRVLAGVLDLAVRMLSRRDDARGRNVAGLRMADYAEALWAIDPALYDAYASNVSTARADMASEDPFIGTLIEWLRARHGTFEGTAEEARMTAQGFQPDSSQWWPRNAKVFSDEVTRTTELLKSAGVTVEDRRSHGRRLKRFTRVEGREE